MLNFPHEEVRFKSPNRLAKNERPVCTLCWWGGGGEGTLVHCRPSLYTGQSGEIYHNHSAHILDLTILSEKFLTKNYAHAK